MKYAIPGPTFISFALAFSVTNAANVESPKPVEVVNTPSVAVGQTVEVEVTNTPTVEVDNFPTTIEVSNFPSTVGVDVLTLPAPERVTFSGSGPRFGTYVLQCFIGASDGGACETVQTATPGELMDATLYVEATPWIEACSLRLLAGPSGSEFDLLRLSTVTTVNTLNYAFPRPLFVDDTASLKVVLSRIGTGTCYGQVVLRYVWHPSY